MPGQCSKHSGSLNRYSFQVCWPRAALWPVFTAFMSTTIVVREVEEGKPGLLWPLFLLLTGVFGGLAALSSVLSLVSPAPDADDAVA